MGRSGQNVACVAGKLGARHLRHGMIGQKQVDVRRGVQNLQCVGARVRLDDAMAEILQHHRRAHRDESVVIDQQTPWPTPCGEAREFGWSVVCRCGVVAVVAGRKSSAVVPLPTSLDKRRVPPDWTARPWIMERPRPGALADALGREERLDGPLQRSIVHAVACVLDPQTQVSARGRVRGPVPDRPRSPRTRWSRLLHWASRRAHSARD